MDITVQPRPDPEIESILFLERMFAQSEGMPHSAKEILLHLSDKYGIPGSVLEDLLGPILTLENKILSELDLPQELLEPFFFPGSVNENQLPWAFFFFEKRGIDFAHLTAEQFPPERQRLIALMLNCEESSLHACGSLQSLSDFLFSFPCSDRTKWICSRIFCQPAYYQSLYRNIMEKVRSKILQAEEPFLSATESTVSLYTAQMEQDPQTFWKQLGLPPQERFSLFPTVIGFNAIGLVWDHSGQDIPTYLIAGIHHDAIGKMIQTYGDNSEFLANRLKSLSDRRRLDILKALKSSPMYGQELAELLSLSPATISHHMSYLVSDGFVTADKQGTRISYDIAREEIDVFLQNLRGALL